MTPAPAMATNDDNSLRRPSFSSGDAYLLPQLSDDDELQLQPRSAMNRLHPSASPKVQCSLKRSRVCFWRLFSERKFHTTAFWCALVYFPCLIHHPRGKYVRVFTQILLLVLSVP